MPNVMQTLVMLPLFGMSEQAIAFANGLDDVCAALGIEQESDAATLLGLSLIRVMKRAQSSISTI